MRALRLVLLLALVPATALAQFQPRAHNTVITPPRPRPKAFTVPRPPTAPTRPTDPTLISPSLRERIAPRLGGLSDSDSGGAQCRTACARDQYVCLPVDDQSRCQAAWSQCVAACPAQSGGAL